MEIQLEGEAAGREGTNSISSKRSFMVEFREAIPLTSMSQGISAVCLVFKVIIHKIIHFTMIF